MYYKTPPHKHGRGQRHGRRAYEKVYPMPECTLGDKTYDITLDVLGIEAVRKNVTVLQGGREVPFNLSDPVHLALLEEDEVALGNAIWHLIDPAQRGTDKRALLRHIRGEGAEQAARAVQEAALDFFPSGKRSNLQFLLDQRRWEREEAQKVVMQELPELRKASLEKTKRTLKAMLSGEAFKSETGELQPTWDASRNERVTDTPGSPESTRED